MIFYQQACLCCTLPKDNSKTSIIMLPKAMKYQFIYFETLIHMIFNKFKFDQLKLE